MTNPIDVLVPAGCTMHLGPGCYGTVRVEGELSTDPDAKIESIYAGGTVVLGEPLRTCKRCRHWAGNRRDDLPRSGPYACKHPKLAESFDFAEPADGAHADDGIGIICGPDFGCLHWEKRE